MSILKKVHISAALLFGSGSVITRFYVAESASIREILAMAVPLLNLPPMSSLPLDQLPSQVNFLQLLWDHVVGNLSGFRGSYLTD